MKGDPVYSSNKKEIAINQFSQEPRTGRVYLFELLLRGKFSRGLSVVNSLERTRSELLSTNE